MTSNPNSYLFTNVEFSEASERFMFELADWCAANHTQCYVVKKPLIEIKDQYDAGDSYAILIPKRKLAFVNFDKNEDQFEEFYDEFIEDIGYISNKYRYKELIGRPKKWRDDLIGIFHSTTGLSLSDYLAESALGRQSDQRVSELLVSLVTGSINNIDRVGVEVPENDLDRIKRNILLFDGDQTRFVYQNFDQKEVRIQGLSGTGKTELLLHKLKELYVASDDSKIIITCHNKILAGNLKKRIPDFFNFMRVEQQIEWDKRLLCVHAWGSPGIPTSGAYVSICSHYGLPAHTWSRSMSFDRACSITLNSLKEQGGIDGDYAFDYMLIDESQDFTESFFELCEMVTRHSVYIAGDIFQSIFDERKEAGAKPEFILSKCYRTAPATLMFAQALGMGYFESEKLNWLNEGDLQACGYISSNDETTGALVLKREPISRFEDIENEKNSVELIRIPQQFKANCCAEIISCLKKIKDAYPNVNPDDIGIIMIDRGKLSYEMSDYLGLMIPREMGWEVNKAFETRQKNKGEVFLSNINHVKGLEFPFVICATNSLSTSHSHRNALYMAITRSFLKTYLLVGEQFNSQSLDNIQHGLEVISREGVLRVQPPSPEEQERIRAQVKWQGGLQTFEDLAIEVLTELKVPASDHQKLMSVLKIMVEPDADKATIKKFIEKLIAG